MQMINDFFNSLDNRSFMFGMLFLSALHIICTFGDWIDEKALLIRKERKERKNG